MARDTKWDWLMNRSKAFLENWIDETIDEITDKDDPRIEGLYVAVKAAYPFNLVKINDEVIAFEELLREKGVDVGRHCVMPRQVACLLGWS